MKYYYVYHQVEGAFTEHVNCEGMLTEVLSKPLLMMKCFHEFQSSKTMNYHNTPKLIVHLSLLKKIPPNKAVPFSCQTFSSSPQDPRIPSLMVTKDPS